jgi:hypothetical protein
MLREKAQYIENGSVRNYVFESIGRGLLPTYILRGMPNRPNLSEAVDAGRIKHENGVITYRFVIRHDYQRLNPPSRWDEIFFVDCFDNEQIGYLKVKHVADMAYVMNIQTDDKYGRMGLAAQRLIMANQYCVEQYGQSLHSGEQTSKKARTLWKSLIDQDLAESTGRSNSHLYRFK